MATSPARSTGTCGSWPTPTGRRASASRKAWAPFLHYCIQGVLRCPTVPQGTVTWRARPEPIASLREVYRPGYEVIVCAFTPSTMDFKCACPMTRYSAGTILQLTLLEGFQLDELSLHPREHEVLLPPNVLGGANDEGRIFAGRRGLPQHVPHPA